jgi:hypothetical protein
MAISQTSLADLSGSILYTNTDSTGTKDAVKASSAVLYAIDVDNSANASAVYCKLWNVASGSVTVGTTAPNMIIMAPASTRVSLPMPAGITFDTATTVATVTTAGTAGTTDPTSDVTVRIVYV